MKIGFPVLKTNSKDSLQLNSSLHSSELFGVFCTDSDCVDIVSLNQLSENESGTGLVKFLQDEKISSVISLECYGMAAKFFADHNIGIYQAMNSHVFNNIEKLLANELPAFGSENVKQKSSCSSSCGDCSSKCDSFEQDVIEI